MFVQLVVGLREQFHLQYYFASAAVAVDSSHMTVSSSTLWSRFSPPSDFVNGHVSTMWCMVCRWPPPQEGDWARPHLCKLAWHGPWPVRKRFVRRCCYYLAALQALDAACCYRCTLICVPVCWSQKWALQKRMNWSKCFLGMTREIKTPVTLNTEQQQRCWRTDCYWQAVADWSHGNSRGSSAVDGTSTCPH